MRCRFLIAGLIVWASAVAPLPARAETGLWAVATDTCSPDGHKCIRGIMKDGAPFTSRAACEQRAHALLRQYTAAHLKVSYIRCVQL
jgi:hypothetical protein